MSAEDFLAAAAALKKELLSGNSPLAAEYARIASEEPTAAERAFALAEGSGTANVAAKMGVSRSALDRAKAILRYGTTDEIALAKAGKIGLSAMAIAVTERSKAKPIKSAKPTAVERTFTAAAEVLAGAMTDRDAAAKYDVRYFRVHDARIILKCGTPEEIADAKAGVQGLAMMVDAITARRSREVKPAQTELTLAERVFAAAEMANTPSGGHRLGENGATITNAESAEKFGVRVSEIGYAKAILRYCTPEEIADARSGKIDLREAVQLAYSHKKREPADEDVIACAAEPTYEEAMAAWNTLSAPVQQFFNDNKAVRTEAIVVAVTKLPGLRQLDFLRERLHEASVRASCDVILTSVANWSSDDFKILVRAMLSEMKRRKVA